ncbi:MAG: geranylgeranyl reductase family protein [Candidatus Hodarchaeales archaeon]|jgi:digeranylgeranylglycerophospholipid reductase
MVETTDIVIIGAGPAGIMAAIEATKKNAEVIILEEHPIVGDPNHCSGLISKNGLDKLKVPYPSSIIDNSVDSVNFYSPANYKISIKRKKKDELLVFRRNELDRNLFTAAEKIGINGRLNSRVVHLNRKKGKIVGVKVKPKNKSAYDIRCKIVIDAEGSSAKFLHAAGLSPPDPHWRLPSLQYELENVDFPSNLVELYHGSRVAPGFFAWIIPTYPGAVRIGLSTWKAQQPSTKRLLDHFLTKHPIASRKLKNATITKKRGGVVTATGPIRKSYSPGFIAVGDVAGQVKATTGGGVNIGGFCGRIAGTVAAMSLDSNESSHYSLKTYEQHWKKKFYQELKLMEYYRKTVGRVNDVTLDRLFKAAADSQFGNALSETQDIDLHSFDILKAALNPTIIKAGLKSSPMLLYRFFQHFI